MSKKPKRTGGAPKTVTIIETGETFRTVRECADYIGGHSSGISNVVYGKRKSHKGFTFYYEEDKKFKTEHLLPIFSHK